ncbi:MAG: CHRD domain-containing protein [Bacteroidota bacterium]
MKKNIPHIQLLVGLVFLSAMIALAKEPPGVSTKNGLNKVTGSPNATLMNINKMSAWYEADGEHERNPNTGNSGLSYPRGTSYVIYASGLMIGGIATDGVSSAQRIAGFSYNKGFQSGAILGSRTGVIENPTDANVRIWRIRKDYPTADLRQDAAEINSTSISSVSDAQIAAVREQYKKDWKEWPTQKGAPFYDVGYLDASKVLVGKGNGVIDWGEDDTYPVGDDRRRNGVLDLGEDANKNEVLDGETPGIADADQVVWAVNNDIGTVESPWKTKALGLEVQNTFWGYNRTDALGNMIFKKFRIIYKGTSATPANSSINNMYLCQWSDPDLGDAGDDFAGCDVTLSLGFVYNSKTLDAEFRKYSLAPPASGYDFLQGPIVPSAGDSAVFNLQYKKGYKNLPMTSFIYFAAGGTYSDPPFNLNGSVQWYQMLRGLPPTPQGPPDPAPLNDPKTGQATSYWLPGDPVAKTGWIDGKIDNPGDRRLLLNSGPFNMAVGDTQELVSAVLAGVGSDYLSSVSVLKFYDKTAQAAYNNLFNLPKPPPAPKLTTVELDKGIILEWDNDAAAVKATEESNSQGFLFEGYNVYQLPSATSPLSNAKKLATYDLITDPATVSQEEFDESSGQILVKPVQLGKNSGLTRYLYITKDEIRNKPLVNGQQYYFAVTAYNYTQDPLATQKSLECTANIMTLTPHTPNPGVVLPYSINDTLIVPSTMIVGDNDAVVGISVFNPTLQVGTTYEVWYGGVATSRTYTIVRTISSSTKYATVTATLSPVDATVAIAKSKGSASFTINDAKNQIEYPAISISSLSGAITGANIRAAGPLPLTGPVVYTFTVVNDTVQGGTWSFPDSLFDDLVAGNLYVNIQTALKPNGEIRGQIADGIFPRSAVASAPTGTLPNIATYAEKRMVNEGVSFYVSPAPLGAKSMEQTVPTKGAVVNVTNPEGTYSIVGPLSSLSGTQSSEAKFDIRFMPGDSNYAATIPRGVAIPTPTMVKFISVPFAVFQDDSIRLWPVILNSGTDTTWDIDALNGLSVTGKPLFDLIVGVCGTKDNNNNDIRYESTLITNAQGKRVPPTSSNVIKGRLINGGNHTLKNISFVNVKGDGVPPVNGTKINMTMFKSIKPGDIRRFTLNAIQISSQTAAKAEVSKVNVFPNPYYGVNTSELRREARFVTINHLPKQATIRIFNLAGSLVTTLTKDSPAQFYNWDLTNHKGLPVASGIYLIHIDMGTLGVKILKSAIIMEQQFLDNY